MSPTRREVLTLGIGAAVAATGLPAAAIGAEPHLRAALRTIADSPFAPFAPTYRQSVARWCFSRTPLDELCREAKRIGLAAIDLLSETDWAEPAKHGLTCAVSNGPGSIPDGWNRPDLHDQLVAESERLLPLIARAGIPQMIVFSGNRRGMGDGEGIANCAAGLRRIMPTAERVGVTVVMEMLNSKVDHKDYHADRTEWAARVARAVGSERFKLLYDVYHMQIMEGDVVRTIGQYAPLIAHYHTAGVPGRHELDDTQELNYGRIARAINATGFTGYVAHEFVPTREPMAKLAEAQAIFAG